MTAIWCGYFDGNEKSKRVSEKCGFRLHHTENNKECPLINETKTQHVACVTKRQFLL
jgi:RimJ/RimL family protein N-acetyltransferase